LLHNAAQGKAQPGRAQEAVEPHLQVRHLPLQAYQILSLLLQLLGNSDGHSLPLTAANAGLRTSPAAAACSRIGPGMALPCC
jgi:hypothetical protein